MRCTRDVNANIANAERLVRKRQGTAPRSSCSRSSLSASISARSASTNTMSLQKPVEENDAVKHFAKVAEELKVVLPISFYEKDGKRLFNTVAILDADGTNLESTERPISRMTTIIRKNSTSHREIRGFKAFKTRYGTIGVGICWDQWFPETARFMAVKGAELLFYPTAIGSEPILSVDSMPHWRRCMQGHSASNLMPVIAANRVGLEEVTPCAANGNQKSALKFYGSSFIMDGAGEVIQSMDRDSEGVITAEFDLDELERERFSWGLFRDRRPEMYHE